MAQSRVLRFLAESGYHKLMNRCLRQGAVAGLVLFIVSALRFGLDLFQLGYDWLLGLWLGMWVAVVIAIPLILYRNWQLLAKIEDQQAQERLKPQLDRRKSSENPQTGEEETGSD
ncbi:MAG: hypothetical protein GDA41_12255 [Rhodospirillales bacterium]|nr:hypothetical protein [Rhodospirillales bacterium]